MADARGRVAVQVNTELLTAYWNVGRIIVEHEQESNIRAAYGRQTLRLLSKELTKEFGKGFSVSKKRSFYEKEAVHSGWSIRELKRQISTSLYERLLLTEGKTNQETVLTLAQKGIEMLQPIDIIKDPYVFEFLGVPENKPILESDLEKALVAQIEKFLLELGRGFMFVGTQQRVVKQYFCFEICFLYTE